MTSPDPDRLVKAIYAKRAIRDRNIKSSEHLRAAVEIGEKV
jgi:hypothetical protein